MLETGFYYIGIGLICFVFGFGFADIVIRLRKSRAKDD